jgi:hypothetical protein
VTAIIFIADQHVRVLLVRNRVIWRAVDTNVLSVGVKKMLRVNGATDSALEIK